jgi:hypothetical protein
MKAEKSPESMSAKQRELLRIREAIESGTIADVDELAEEEYLLLLELHPSREELEAFFDELRGERDLQ